MQLQVKQDGLEIVAKGEAKELKSFFGGVLNTKVKVEFDIASDRKKDKGSKPIFKKINAHTIEVDGVQLSLNDIANKEQGKDYYVFKDDEGQYFINHSKSGLTLSPIGGFHYGLIPEDFKGANNISKKDAKKIRGINAYSFWDNNHKPTCSPEGMVYIPNLNIWVDIYLTNSNAMEVGTSKAGLNIVAGDDYNGRELPNGKDELKGADVDEIGKKWGKRLLGQDEFRVAMYGVKEGDSAGELDDGTIKHIQDFISKYGIEQATGVQWIWSKDEYTTKELRVLLGGYRDNGVSAGSRASHWYYCVWDSGWYVGCRFACDHLKLETMSESE